MSSSIAASAMYEIKSADLPLVAFQLRSSDLQAVDAALTEQLRETPGFFDQEPTLIDLDSLPPENANLDVLALIDVLTRHGLRALAVKSLRDDLRHAATQAGLVLADDARVRRPAPAVPAAHTSVPPDVPAPVAPSLAEALVLDKPLRSGQQCYAKGRDLIVLAMVNPGAEVLADGHIHVYAPLRGKAIAGARGFAGARIFAQSMDPELISIAGVYRTSENPLPAEVRGLAAQVSLHSGSDGERLVITPLQV